MCGRENGMDGKELCAGRRSGVGRQDVMNQKPGCSESPSRALAVVLATQCLIVGLCPDVSVGGWAGRA